MQLADVVHSPDLARLMTWQVAVDEVGGLETLEGIRRIKGQREVEGVRTM